MSLRKEWGEALRKGEGFRR